jgi:hypothetical protein
LRRGHDEPDFDFRAPGAVTLRVGPDLFDTVQLQANNVVNEDAEALRLDFKINQKHSAYFRFFRDKGFNSQPDGVTGRRVLVEQVPQNGIIALQSTLRTNLLNEFKFGYNSSWSRSTAVLHRMRLSIFQISVLTSPVAWPVCVARPGS